MTETEHDQNKQDVHRSTTFYGGVRTLLSIGLYASIGAIAGHYLGRWGEDATRGERGMSTILGRWMGGVGLGGLAAYVSLRGTAEEERQRDELKETNMKLESRLKVLEAEHPAEKVESKSVEHSGKVITTALHKTV